MYLKPKGFQALGLKLQFRPAIEIGKCLKCDSIVRSLTDERKLSANRQARVPNEEEWTACNISSALLCVFVNFWIQNY
jgi:hypothetical protein